MPYDTEDWYKIWRKTDFLFQKRQEFGEFWSEHSKASKIYTLIDAFCEKYVIFDLKKHRGAIFQDNTEIYKIWGKTVSRFGK